jgi:glutathione S-transferase
MTTLTMTTLTMTALTMTALTETWQRASRMPRLRLVIANKNYSSWSMRPWVLMRQAEIAFEEVMVPFDTEAWATRVPMLTPTGQVPVLWIDDEPVWDSLAIAEAVAELFPAARLWPADARARRRARSISAEMHSGFGELRRRMPMNMAADLRGHGHTPEVTANIERVVAIWTECRAAAPGDGPLLFGGFTVADAMFAPVVSRLHTYGVHLPPVAAAYADAVRALPSVRAWTEAALLEEAFVARDEPYRAPPR